MLGDGVIELHNLQTGGVDLNLKGWTKLKTNLLKRQSKKGLGADAHLCLTLDRVWKDTKAFQEAKPNTFQIYLTIHFDEIVTENLWDSAILYPKLLAVEKEQAQKLV